MKRWQICCIFISFVLMCGHSPSIGADIHEAAKSDSLAQVQQLLAHDSSLINVPDPAGRTPLHWACRGVHFEIVQHLVQVGAAINAADINGMIPLHNVAARGHVDAARLLITNGADLDQQSIYDSGTSLHYATNGGFEDIFSLLLNNEAQTGLQDNLERTSLHLAVLAGQKDILALLVNKASGVDPALLNIGDFDDNTALHLACLQADLESVAALVAGGTDINARNTVGLTPFNIAVEGNRNIADFLVQNGADRSPQKFPVLTGPYLGQTPPGRTPQLFAKGIVSTSRGMHANIAFSPDLREAVWESRDTVYVLKMVNNTWSAPEKLVFFKENYSVDAPFFSHDGQRLFFIAGLRDTANRMNDERIWYVERQGPGWSAPELFDSVVNSEATHWQASMDKEGNVYTSGIYCTHYTNGKYTAREKLPAVINVIPDTIKYAGEVGPFISPDGDYLIFTRFTPPPPRWRTPLLISFKGKDGNWTEPKNLGDKLQGEGGMARVSPDGKYLFFLSNRPGSAGDRSVYWVEAGVIEELRPALEVSGTAK